MIGRTALRTARSVAKTYWPQLHDVSYRVDHVGFTLPAAAAHMDAGGTVRVTARERMPGGEMRDLGYVSACLHRGSVRWEAFDNQGRRAKLGD